MKLNFWQILGIVIIVVALVGWLTGWWNPAFKR